MKNEGHEMQKDWDDVWSQKGVLARIVDMARRFYNNFFKNLLNRYIIKETNMIEFGCGTSSIGFLLAGSIDSYHGVDISPLIVESTQSKASKLNKKNMTFEIADCRGYTNNNKRFNLVWSHGLIEHFKDPAAVVQSHVDTAGPKGTVLISVPYKYSIHTLWYKIAKIPGLHKLWPWTEQENPSRKDLLEFGKKTGYKSRVFFLPPSPFGFLLGLIILEIKKDD
ncbi:MAG: methyltransferase domain-containing protein [bacterium]|nr:methyltransferase domain-containing protein [bacterium]